jgi:uncharacterized membrane protein YgaE (UPF0421/DUF939 family)
VQNHYIDLNRIIHSLKTALAALLGYALAEWIGTPSAQWVVISIVVVMCAQIHASSVLQKSYMRFLGTLIGCLIAAITIKALGSHNLAISLAIVCASLFFSYLATSSENWTNAATLGATTTIIILMSDNPTLITAGERFIEISLGITIATLVSQFILPIHAEPYLKATEASTIEQLREYYLAYIVNFNTNDNSQSLQEFDESITKLLSQQRALAKESARERIGANFDRDHFMQILQCEKELLRAIYFMHLSMLKSNAIKDILHLPAIDTFHQHITQAFTSLIHLVGKKRDQSELIYALSIAPLATAIYAYPAITAADSTYLNGFLFSAECLTDQLKNLANLHC